MDKIFFIIKNIATDVITAINGTPMLNAKTAVEYVSANNTNNVPYGSWWIEQDTAGQPVLCTYCRKYTDYMLSIQDTAGNTYTAERCDFIQGHPIHYPR
jgi:hypothetical protein